MGKAPSKYFVFLGLFFTSTSSVFIRIIDAPALTIASYRLFASSMFFLGIFISNLWKKESTLDRRSIFLSIVSGVFLAAHFGTWISSLDYTTVASSTVLVSLSPLFVAFFNFAVLKEKLKKIQVIGIIFSFIGAIIISAGDFNMAGEALYGDFLAFSGAIFVAGYLLIGKTVRKTVKLVDYVFVTYTSAAITLFLFSFITKVNLYPFATSELLLMLLHGIVCSGLGHSTYNWMLQHVSSTYVSTVTLGEPVFASLMVFVLLSEAPTFQTIMGGVVVIAGLYIFIKQK